MRRLTGLLAALAVGGSLAGCALSSDDAYPVSDNGPNPAPVRGYRVECRTVPNVPNLFGDDRVTGCRQIIPPPGETVVRARG